MSLDRKPDQYHFGSLRTLLVSYLSYASKMGPKRFVAKVLFTILFIINMCRICAKIESVFSHLLTLICLILFRKTNLSL